MSSLLSGPEKQVLTSLTQTSEEFLQELRNYLEINPPATPITSILGFSGFLGIPATDVLTAESTTSLTYTDLATVGPELTGLSDGQYLLVFGFTAENAGGVVAPSINGASADDSQAAFCQPGGGITIADAISTMRLLAVSLKNNGNSSVTLKYRSDGTNTGTFLYRWLVAFRFGNE